MKELIIGILIGSIITIGFFVISGALNTPSGLIINKQSALESTFLIYTKAICEKAENKALYCKDKLFAKCGDEEIPIPIENFTLGDAYIYP